MMLSPSQIACDAVGLSADVDDLLAISEDTSCVTCGVHLSTGDLVAHWSPKDSFTDYSALADKTGKYVCQHCNVVLNVGDFSQRWLQTIFHKTGCYQTASSDMRAHALLNPPPPPFVWILGDQKVQHVVWKAPVTLDHEAIFIRFGERTLMIRKSYLASLFSTVKEAIQEWGTASLAAWEESKLALGKKAAGKAPKVYKTPFVELDRDYCAAQYAGLNPRFVEHAHSPAGEKALKAIKLIEKSTPGEIWALTALMYAKQPEEPRLVADPKGFRFIKPTTDQPT